MKTPADVFDDWFSDTHGGTGEFEIEGDCDEILEDTYQDVDLY